MVIPKSSEVKFEADIQINCSITESTTYTWKVYNATSNTAMEDFSLRDPVFYLQPRYLPYGNYTVELKVRPH